MNLETGIAKDGRGFTDTLSNIEGVIGSNGDDIFIGKTGVDNIFYGKQGFDVLKLDGSLEDYEITRTTDSASGKAGFLVEKLAANAAMPATDSDLIFDIDALHFSIDGEFSPITASGYEHIMLGRGEDYFIGDIDRDWIETGGGADNIYAGAGDDVISIQPGSQSAPVDFHGIQADEIFTVTVQNTVNGNKYFINGEQQATLKLEAGKTYLFDQSDVSNGSHPLGLSSSPDGVHGGGSVSDNLSYEVGGFAGGPGAYTRITLDENVEDIFYFCEAHPSMGAEIEISEYQPEEVHVDTGTGDDTVIVEEGWSGTLFLKNGSGNNILELKGNQEDIEMDIVEGQLELYLNNGSTIKIEESAFVE